MKKLDDFKNLEDLKKFELKETELETLEGGYGGKQPYTTASCSEIPGSNYPCWKVTEWAW